MWLRLSIFARSADGSVRYSCSVSLGCGSKISAIPVDDAKEGRDGVRIVDGVGPHFGVDGAIPDDADYIERLLGFGVDAATDEFGDAIVERAFSGNGPSTECLDSQAEQSGSATRRVCGNEACLVVEVLHVSGQRRVGRFCGAGLGPEEPVIEPERECMAAVALRNEEAGGGRDMCGSSLLGQGLEVECQLLEQDEGLRGTQDGAWPYGTELGAVPGLVGEGAA